MSNNNLEPALRSTLSALESGTDEALQTLFVLQQTINNNGLPEMAPWPEILDKYDVMMRKLQGLQNRLEKGFASPDGTGFMRFTSLRDLAVVPSQPFGPGEPQDMFNLLTRTMREPSVREADEAAVARVNERLQLDNLADEVINVRMTSLIDQHDTRVAIAVSIMEELASQYNWQRRENDLDDEETHTDLAHGNSMDTIGPSVSQRQPARVEDDSDDDMEMVAGNFAPQGS